MDMVMVIHTDIKSKKLMFSFLKRKTYLREILYAGFTDYHNHLLPGLDDGCKTTDQSIACIRKLTAMGAHTISCTPHIMDAVHNNTRTTITSAMNKLKDEESKVTSSVTFAAEYMLDNGFQQHLSDPLALQIGNEQMLLIELGSSRMFALQHILFEICTSRLIPLLAHPERYSYYHNKPEVYQELRDSGCRFQLNLLSLSGHYGSSVQKAAIFLLRNNFYSCVGTDAHHIQHLHKIEQIKIDNTLIKHLTPILRNEKKETNSSVI